MELPALPDLDFHVATRRYAAIDVGSNTIRLLVAEVEGDGSYRILDDERDMPRLGQGLAETGRLAPRAMRAALQTLEKMRAIAAGHGAQLRLIATDAVRTASNGSWFCREVKRRTGLQIETVSGEEEARFAFQSAARHFTLDGHTSAIVDIGGGSLDVVFAAEGNIERTASLPLGAVRLSEGFCRSDPLRKKHWRRLRKAIDEALAQELGLPPFPIDQVIGSGGTFHALAEIIECERKGGNAAKSVHGRALSAGDVGRVLDFVRHLSLEERRKIPGLSPDRADIIVAGVAVIERLLRHIGARQLVVNERGIRDGILLRTMEEDGSITSPGNPAPRDRMDWVRAFARRCRSNERHCEHVARLALEIFSGLEVSFQLPRGSRDLLEAAALLHDAGCWIQHQQHHKHAYHLILHSRIAGFSARELRMIANVARYHRRALPSARHAGFSELTRKERKLVRRLGGILRIANGLDRTHSRRVKGARSRVREDGVAILLEAPDRPVIELLDARREARAFEEAFKAPLFLRWTRQPPRRRHALVPGRSCRARGASLPGPLGSHREGRHAGPVESALESVLAE